MKTLFGIPTVLFWALGTVCVLLVSTFRLRNGYLKRIHSEKTREWMKTIQRHREQVAHRQYALGTYDFIHRNLKEVLKIQKDIEV